MNKENFKKIKFENDDKRNSQKFKFKKKEKKIIFLMKKKG